MYISVCVNIHFCILQPHYSKALDFAEVLPLSKIKIQMHSWSLCTFAFVITIMLFKKGI